MSKYQVWECKLIVPENIELPNGFDSPPRMAVKEVMYKHNIPIVALFSGWGGRLDKGEIEYILYKEADEKKKIKENTR